MTPPPAPPIKKYTRDIEKGVRYIPPPKYFPNFCLINYSVKFIDLSSKNFVWIRFYFWLNIFKNGLLFLVFIAEKSIYFGLWWYLFKITNLKALFLIIFLNFYFNTLNFKLKLLQVEYCGPCWNVWHKKQNSEFRTSQSGKKILYVIVFSFLSFFYTCSLLH